LIATRLRRILTGCSAINPIGGYAAFYDTSFPPIQDTITQFGCMRWYDAGANECPHIVLPSGACCLTTGECLFLIETECLAQPLYLEWKGDGTTCTPDNPCDQPGACCNLETGACAFVLPRDCQPPLSFVGGTCTPVNPCPQLGACCEPLTGNCTYVLAATAWPRACGTASGPAIRTTARSSPGLPAALRTAVARSPTLPSAWRRASGIRSTRAARLTTPARRRFRPSRRPGVRSRRTTASLITD